MFAATPKKIKAFVELSSTRYHDMPATDEHEMEHNYGHKMEWGKAGLAALKALEIEGVAILIKSTFDKSGSLDRGYVSGFFNSLDGTKTVSVSINDGTSDILYRTAKHPADYTGGPNNTASITEAGFDRVAQFIFNYFDTKN